MVFSVNYDDDDIGRAYDDLEDRYCVGEGAGDTDMIHSFGDHLRATRLRNWKAYEALSSPQLESLDHRILSLPEMDRATMMRGHEERLGLAPDTTVTVPWFEVLSNTALAQIEYAGTSVVAHRTSGRSFVSGRRPGDSSRVLRRSGSISSAPPEPASRNSQPNRERPIWTMPSCVRSAAPAGSPTIESGPPSRTSWPSIRRRMSPSTTVDRRCLVPCGRRPPGVRHAPRDHL